ncbi:MAG: TadE family protein [Planctomycetota bacterium]
MNTNPRAPRRRRGRRGAAVVEFAIALPVFVLIVLGTIETISMIFLQQGLKIAAYEATRVALVPGTSTAEVQEAANRLLSNRRIAKATVTVSPSNFQSQSYGTPISVRVTAACNDNSVIVPMFYLGRTLDAEVSMMKET